MTAEAPAVAAISTPTLDPGAEILARHLDGDPRAFGELIQRFGGGVYGYLRRSGLADASADDLFQETFLRVHRSARRYDPHRPFKTWMFAIAANLVRSHFRKQKVRRVMVGWWRGDRTRPQEPPAELDPPEPRVGPEQLAEDRQRLAVVEQALAGLPDGSRQALLLTQVEGLSLEEAARALDVPVATAKTWVRRGRLRLAEHLAVAEGNDRPPEVVADQGDVS
jgi:RNA polymerase sigma-70 factor (ECF subfamily)